jgi:hypothetical protein
MRDVDQDLCRGQIEQPYLTTQIASQTLNALKRKEAREKQKQSSKHKPCLEPPV